MREIDDLMVRVRSFADAQDRQAFHTPKNLSMALAAEAGELLAEFQWLTPNDSRFESLTSDQLEAITLEIADVMIYLVRLCDVLHVDPIVAADAKLAINDLRFPASR